MLMSLGTLYLCTISTHHIMSVVEEDELVDAEVALQHHPVGVEVKIVAAVTPYRHTVTIPPHYQYTALSSASRHHQ